MRLRKGRLDWGWRSLMMMRAGADQLQRVGCLGRISSFSETDDGRMVVSLTGVARFAVAEELNVLTSYRQIRADYRPFESDLIADVGSMMSIARACLMC
jgi:Lon protease-like protein